MSEEDGSRPPGLLIDMLTDPLMAIPRSLLANGARFRSPYADYLEPDVITSLVGLIRQVLEDVHVERQLSDPSTTISTFSARVKAEQVQGVLVEERDHDGHVADAMLTVRPYGRLRVSMTAMNELMKRTPPWNRDASE